MKRLASIILLLAVMVGSAIARPQLKDVILLVFENADSDSKAVLQQVTDERQGYDVLAAYLNGEDAPAEVLNRLSADGFAYVYVQPAFLKDKASMDKLKEVTEEAKGGFTGLFLGESVLSTDKDAKNAFKTKLELLLSTY